jgi:hypothetical protein
MAVGTYGSESHYRILAESWNGTHWAIVPTPDPAASRVAQLANVDCPSTTVCLATGGHLGSPGPSGLRVGGILESWNGTKWVLLSPPNPARWDLLGHLSCASTTHCTVVAVLTGSVSGGMLSWNDGDWTPEAVASPKGTSFVQLNALSCPASTCMAVGTWGEQYTVNEHGGSLAEWWNGTIWSILPTPGGSSRSLSAVSCVSPADCVAVGSSQSVEISLAERWDGQRWSVMTTPSRGNASALVAVSCVSATGCMAVGSPAEFGGAGTVLAEWWNGKNWAVTQS